MEKIPYIYFAIISLVSIIVTCHDKTAARKGRRRVPEKTLFLLSLAGGSVATYFTMKIIRHKTKHKRFMIGLPMIIIFQILILIFIAIML